MQHDDLDECADSSSTNKEAVSLFEKYHQEISKVIHVDEFNMKQVQMELPSNRHYWVGRLMHHKSEVSKLQKMRKQAISKIADKLQADSPIALTHKSAQLSAEHHNIILKIDEQICENELLVEYLSKIEANFRSISYDIKNLIEIIRLETT